MLTSFPCFVIVAPDGRLSLGGILTIIILVRVSWAESVQSVRFVGRRVDIRDSPDVGRAGAGARR